MPDDLGGFCLSSSDSIILCARNGYRSLPNQSLRVSAAFCALDPKKPAQVTNLIVKRSALYSSALAYRAALERMKQRPVCLPSVQDLHIGAWCGSDDIDTANWQVELPSIAELERPLPPHVFESIEKHEMGLQDYHYVAEVLNGFYRSRTLKKMKWERQRAVRAEMDLAVQDALGMVNKHRPSLFVYGNAKFNTHTRLASLHESFKGYFFKKPWNTTLCRRTST
ncbi:hypothetical protein BGZ99_009171 [Dissophora globulifera]|uniref:Uncharacterized protein n=1 Tax=Dissophora globulifera TaxID=979702 RepID=A0A9P6UNK5_9FUNG|nr:hypothetical protein BGZ99_009171 [Dissophora globulifera]